ncbi:DUF2550 domain-containing protein [Pilimelia columellifera]|uniref:DUF2550 domain-containing protein n=1 Tax=Pilimelia columellifera subsp. columellifera TaxID=706583 RepID=A0ABN3NIP5_9ACTN
MSVLEAIGIGFGLASGALVLVTLVLFLRRAAISGSGGTIRLQVRLSTSVRGRGWSPGLARFVGDELRWYRLFSVFPWPRQVLSRRGLIVRGRRAPEGPERLTMSTDSIILRCQSGPATFEIAMASGTLTGFLSWLEAAAPGEGPPRATS